MIYSSILLCALVFLYTKHLHDDYSIIEYFSKDIEAYLSNIDNSFEIDKIHESWSGVNPILHVKNISTNNFSAYDIRAEIDTLQSIKNFSLITKDISVSKIEVSPGLSNKEAPELTVDSIPFSAKSTLKIHEIIYHGKQKDLNFDNFHGNIEITDKSILVTANLSSGFININLAPNLETATINSSLFLNDVFEFIKANLNSKIGAINLSGKAFTEVKYDLTKNEIINEGIIEIDNASLNIKNANLTIDQISGTLTLDKDYNLIGNIDYTILGGESSGEIKFLDDFKRIALNGDGKIDGAKIKTIKGAEKTNFISGEIPYQVDFELTPSSIRIHANANSEKVKIDLPKPYNPNQGKIISEINILPKERKVSLSFSYDDNDVLIKTIKGKVKQINVSKNKKINSNMDGDINISGSWDEVEVDQWLKQFSAKEPVGRKPVIQFEAEANKLILDGLTLNDFKGSGFINEERKIIKFASQEVSGVLDESSEINIDINQLDIAKFKSSLTRKKQDSPTEKIINIDINKMNLNDVKGDGIIKISHIGNNTEMKISEFNLGNLSLTGNITRDGDEIHLGSTEKMFEVQGRNINSSDKFPISSTRFKLNTYLSWSGLGEEFKKDSLNGKAYLKGTGLKITGLKNEKFIKIINAIDIKKILSKGGSDGDGINFDEFKINTVFNDGVMTPLDDVLKIDGADLNLEISGSYSLPADNIDAKIKAYTGISSKALSLGLLTGITPQLAGGIYILDMVAGDQIGKVFAKNIKVKGSLSSPEID